MILIKNHLAILDLELLNLLLFYIYQKSLSLINQLLETILKKSIDLFIQNY